MYDKWGDNLGICSWFNIFKLNLHDKFVWDFENLSNNRRREGIYQEQLIRVHIKLNACVERVNHWDLNIN